MRINTEPDLVDKEDAQDKAEEAQGRQDLSKQVIYPGRVKKSESARELGLRSVICHLASASAFIAHEVDDAENVHGRENEHHIGCQLPLHGLPV